MIVKRVKETMPGACAGCVFHNDTYLCDKAYKIEIINNNDTCDSGKFIYKKVEEKNGSKKSV